MTQADRERRRLCDPDILGRRHLGAEVGQEATHPLTVGVGEEQDVLVAAKAVGVSMREHMGLDRLHQGGEEIPVDAGLAVLGVVALEVVDIDVGDRHAGVAQGATRPVVGEIREEEARRLEDVELLVVLPRCEAKGSAERLLCVSNRQEVGQPRHPRGPDLGEPRRLHHRLERPSLSLEMADGPLVRGLLARSVDRARELPALGENDVPQKLGVDRMNARGLEAAPELAVDHTQFLQDLAHLGRLKAPHLLADDVDHLAAKGRLEPLDTAFEDLGLGDVERELGAGGVSRGGAGALIARDGPGGLCVGADVIDAHRREDPTMHRPDQRVKPGRPRPGGGAIVGGIMLTVSEALAYRALGLWLRRGSMVLRALRGVQCVDTLPSGVPTCTGVSAGQGK